MNKALGTLLQRYLWISEKMDIHINPLLSDTCILITVYHISHPDTTSG